MIYSITAYSGDAEPLSERRARSRHITRIARSLKTSPDELRAIWNSLEAYVPYYDGKGDRWSRWHTPNDSAAEVRTWRIWRPVVDALARNPNTPADLLPDLAYHAPRAFCRNPVTPLLALEDPFWVNLLRDRPQPEGHPTIMRLLRCEEAPHSLVALIASGSLIPHGIATEEASLHVAMDGESGSDEWLGEVRDYWRRGAAEWAATAPEQFRELAIAHILPAWAAGGGTGSTEEAEAARQRFRTASDPETPEPELIRLAEGGDSWLVRLAAHLNPSAPAPTRSRLQGATLGVDVGLRAAADLSGMAREYGALKTGAKVRAVCVELFWRLFTAEYADTKLYTLHEQESKEGEAAEEKGGIRPAGVKAELMRFFLRVLHSPSIVRDPARSQEVGEHWVPLLAWVLGVRPGPDGNWRRGEADGLRALTRDGNRWVRAAARAKLKDPGFTSSW